MRIFTFSCSKREQQIGQRWDEQDDEKKKEGEKHKPRRGHTGAWHV
jgi:hypothetical protein